MAPETEAAPPMLRMAVAFGRLLRRVGLAAGPDRVVGFATALQELDVGSRDRDTRYDSPCGSRTTR